MQAWTLGGVIPPTFAERGARLWSPGEVRFQLDAQSGLRLSAECRQPHDLRRQSSIARWPALASPWLSAAARRESALPPLSPDCMPDQRDATRELRVEGINDGATLALAPGTERGLPLRVRALGTDGDVQWLLDGRLIALTRRSRWFVHDFQAPGEHTLTALADSGAWTRVRFRVAR